MLSFHTDALLQLHSEIIQYVCNVLWQFTFRIRYSLENPVEPEDHGGQFESLNCDIV